MNYKLNLKAISIAEGLLDAAFTDFDFSDIDTNLTLMYAVYVANTGGNMTLDDFKDILDEKISTDIRKALDFSGQFDKSFDESQRGSDDPTSSSQRGSGDSSADVMKGVKLSEQAIYLIVRGGLDPHYVMYEMDLYEMGVFAESIGEVQKERMEEQRLWTYYSILPHVGSDKLKHPSDLLTFAWEEDSKRRQYLKELEANEERLNKFLQTKIELK